MLATDMTAKEAGDGLPADYLAFLKELAKNNNREWFAQNKARYEASVRDPTAALVEAVGGRLGRLSAHLVADGRPVGGSIMRIYRDIRFSKDKSPYRTSVGIHFFHEKAKGHDDNFPGFFLHLAPGESFVAAGVWQPAPPTLKKIRDGIVRDGARWKQLRKSVPELEGESLKRPPQGYSPEHPLMEDLKRKDFITSIALPDQQLVEAGFPSVVLREAKRMNPLNAFLAKAIGIPY